MYFHTLFWPALLHGADYRTPTAIFCHGFLTIGGQKMSKSRGTFIKARTYLNHLNPEYLRYYLATKLNNRIEDLDIHFDDFILRINSDLIGKLINIASRCASFITRYFAGQLSKTLSEPELYAQCAALGNDLFTQFENREFNHVTRQVMEFADRINQYIDEKKPWVLIKDVAHQTEVQDICTMGINLFRLLMIYLKPILPRMAQQVETFLAIPPLTWKDKEAPLLNHVIQPFQSLGQRIEKNHIEALKCDMQNNV